MTAPAAAHPIRLVVTDDLRRSRLTVLFRLPLAVPHFFWLGLWSSVVFVVVIISWFATLVKGTSPQGVHDFLAGYLRYATHVEAYLFLAANPYPGFFLGRVGAYPIDLEIDPPHRQARWKTFLRFFLALPALLLAGVLAGGPLTAATFRTFGVSGTAAFLAWFAALAACRAPRGLRDATAWSIGYAAQTGAYLVLLTDRYPYSGPEAFLGDVEAPAVHDRLPRLVNADDPRRSRLTVLFRIPLVFPHVLWYLGWSILALAAAISNWLSALAIGRSPRPLARFLAAYIRYTAHFTAFAMLVGNPFPGFVGGAGTYPVDVRIDPFARQSRWVTLFRLPLAVPALLVSGAISSVLILVALLGWFASLAKGRMPAGLQSAGAYAIGYSAQVQAYSYVLTDRYPHASPLAVVEGQA